MNALQPAGRALEGSKALVVGVANEHSITWGCAKAFHELGAQVALTYLNEKAKAWVEALAQSIGAPMLAPLDGNFTRGISQDRRDGRRYPPGAPGREVNCPTHRSY